MFINKNKVVPTPPNKTSEVICHAELVSASIQYHPTSILPVQGGRIVTKNYKSAFTLAEVLITLVIIGVIAAITVPTLINNTNKQEYVSKLRKVHSTLVQATNLIIANEGTPRADKGGWATNSQDIYDLYRKKLHNTKECNYVLTEDGNIPGCFSQLKNGGRYYYLDGSDYWRPNATDGLKSFILADGTQVLIERNVLSNCNTYCVSFRVDVNGAKKPNILGRDLFQFVLTEKGLYPSGYNAADKESVCSKNNAGWGCAARVLKENAMNY